MTDKLAIAWRYIEDSDTQNTSLRENIEDSDDYYFGRKPGPPEETTGRSCSVSMDVQTMITAVLASTIDGFTGGQPAHFLPLGDNDDVQAELESMAVDQVITDSGGYGALHGAMDSALRYKNGVMHAWVQDKKITEKRELPETATAQQLAEVVASIPETMDPVVKGTTVSWTRTEQTVEVEVVDVARLRYPKDHDSMNFQTMPFVALEHRDLRKDMVDMGFDNDIVEKLPQHSEGTTSQSSIRSKLLAEERGTEDAPIRELDYVTWFECWVQIPGADGTTQLERIATSDRKMLDNTPATHVPLATGAAFPQAHRFQGISLFDKLKSVQVSKTEGIRQYEDNLAANNNPKTVTFGVNLDDAMNGRVDGVMRAENPNFRYEPVQVPDLTQGSLAFLNYMDNIRGELGGSALAMQAPESQLLKSQIGAVGSQQVIAAQEQISAYISKNLGETLIRGLFLLVHRVLREDFTGTLLLRRADQAVQVQPRDWQERSRIALTAGMSPSARNRKAANLMVVLQTQMGMMQAGLPLVDPNGIHAALRDWGFASDLPMNSYVTDPDSQKGQQLAQQAGQAQQAQQEQQQQMVQMQNELESAKLQMDKYKADLSAQVDLAIANLRAQVDEAKLTLEGLRDAADIDRAQVEGPQVAGANGAAGSGG